MRQQYAFGVLLWMRQYATSDKICYVTIIELNKKQRCTTKVKYKKLYFTLSRLSKT